MQLQFGHGSRDEDVQLVVMTASNIKVWDARCDMRGPFCRKALERMDPRVLRLMFAMAPWEKPMTYADSGETMGEAQRKDEVLKSFFARADALLKKFNPVSAPGLLAMKWLVGCPSSPLHLLESPTLLCTPHA